MAHSSDIGRIDRKRSYYTASFYTAEREWGDDSTEGLRLVSIQAFLPFKHTLYIMRRTTFLQPMYNLVFVLASARPMQKPCVVTAEATMNVRPFATNSLNRKRVKHRLEFDTGGRKWINLDEEQVRKMTAPT